MAEYIKREELIESIRYGSGTSMQKMFAECCVYAVPTADVVEVVRCKDCKYCVHGYPVKAIGEEALEGWYCKTRKRCMRPDDFCSYGERKEDE